MWEGDFGEARLAKFIAPFIVTLLRDDPCAGCLDILEGVVLICRVHPVPDIDDSVVNVFSAQSAVGPLERGVFEETWCCNGCKTVDSVCLREFFEGPEHMG